MLKYFRYILIMACFIFVSFGFGSSADAATFKGTFVNATYTETELEDGTSQKKLSKITIKNDSGKTTTLNIDDSAYLYVNNTATTIDAFKSGMKIQAKVNLRKVTELNGTSDVGQGQIVAKSKQKSGVVTKVNPNGLSIKVKLDVGDETTFYVNKNTHFIKGHDTVDVSALYEGDRVHLKFSTPSTSVVAEVEIVTEGILIENLYKGTLQSINTSANKLTVRNAQAYKNWSFGTNNNSRLSTYSFTNNTPIYVGNKKVTKNELLNYKTSDVYFVTVDQLGKEVIKKIIVLENYERTYYEPMTAVNLSSKFIGLKYNGKVKFHEGTILVRNGRLVEPSTLVAYGTAFVVTDGGTKDNFAQVINISNDSLMAPNLQNHELYFGQLTSVNGYEATVGNMFKLEDNVWTGPLSYNSFSFSNSTNIEENFRNSTLSIVPDMDLFWKTGDYGYFYVKDGHIQAIHFLERTESIAPYVSTGRIENINATSQQITVKDVSRWENGAWRDTGSLPNVNINKAFILRDGKVIEPKDLNSNDRVIIITTNTINGHVLIVNE